MGKRAFIGCLLILAVSAPAHAASEATCQGLAPAEMGCRETFTLASDQAHVATILFPYVGFLDATLTTSTGHRSLSCTGFVNGSFCQGDGTGTFRKGQFAILEVSTLGAGSWVAHAWS
jgi:hypothetical protein